jgi:hypothetical protein
LFFFNMFLWTFKPKALWDEWEPENPNVPFILLLAVFILIIKFLFVK